MNKYDYFGDSKIVDVNIRRLREKIEATPSKPTEIYRNSMGIWA